MEKIKNNKKEIYLYDDYYYRDNEQMRVELDEKIQDDVSLITNKKKKSKEKRRE